MLYNAGALPRGLLATLIGALLIVPGLIGHDAAQSPAGPVLAAATPTSSVVAAPFTTSAAAAEATATIAAQPVALVHEASAMELLPVPVPPAGHGRAIRAAVQDLRG